VQVLETAVRAGVSARVPSVVGESIEIGVGEQKRRAVAPQRSGLILQHVRDLDVVRDGLVMVGPITRARGVSVGGIPGVPLGVLVFRARYLSSSLLSRGTYGIGEVIRRRLQPKEVECEERVVDALRLAVYINDRDLCLGEDFRERGPPGRGNRCPVEVRETEVLGRRDVASADSSREVVGQSLNDCVEGLLGLVGLASSSGAVGQGGRITSNRQR